MASAEPKRTKADILAKRERILADWSECYSSRQIAERQDCSQSNVHRIIREYGDPDCPTRTERGIEMKRAEQYYENIVKNYNEGASIDQIAKSYGLLPREVRAGVYLGIQRGHITAFLPGVVQEDGSDDEAVSE